MASRWSRVSRLVLLVAVAAGWVLPAAPAWAAQTLTGAVPGDGAALATAPPAVQLTFSASPVPDDSHLSVRDEAGQEVSIGEPTRSGTDALRLPLEIRGTGDFTVAYHVVFVDGADLFGVLRFSVGTAVPPAALPAAQVQRARQRLDAAHRHSVDPLSAMVLVADGVVLAGGLLVLFLRPRPGSRRAGANRLVLRTDEATGRDPTG
jgi:methionine-rich copper-binding protein CopC